MHCYTSFIALDSRYSLKALHLVRKVKKYSIKESNIIWSNLTRRAVLVSSPQGWSWSHTHHSHMYTSTPPSPFSQAKEYPSLLPQNMQTLHYAKKYTDRWHLFKNPFCKTYVHFTRSSSPTIIMYTKIHLTYACMYIRNETSILLHMSIWNLIWMKRKKQWEWLCDE